MILLSVAVSTIDAFLYFYVFIYAYTHDIYSNISNKKLFSETRVLEMILMWIPIINLMYFFILVHSMVLIAKIERHLK